MFQAKRPVSRSVTAHGVLLVYKAGPQGSQEVRLSLGAFKDLKGFETSLAVPSAWQHSTHPTLHHALVQSAAASLGFRPSLNQLTKVTTVALAHDKRTVNSTLFALSLVEEQVQSLLVLDDRRERGLSERDKPVWCDMTEGALQSADLPAKRYLYHHGGWLPTRQAKRSKIE